jgi:hypothetical protein
MNGGVEEDRTPDLRIANATLSQLSYNPTQDAILTAKLRADNAPAAFAGTRSPGL